MPRDRVSKNWKLEVVGPPGIEPGLNAPHALVLPVYYGPFSLKLAAGKPVISRIDDTTKKTN